jgi:hypothetical protein
MNISTEVRSHQKELVALRRAIHQYPEEGFKEFRTSALVWSKLKSWGVDHRAMCGTGTVALIKDPVRADHADRADMDALLTEENKIPYCSRNRGVTRAATTATPRWRSWRPSCSRSGARRSGQREIHVPARRGRPRRRRAMMDGLPGGPKVDAAFAIPCGTTCRRGGWACGPDPSLRAPTNSR